MTARSREGWTAWRASSDCWRARNSSSFCREPSLALPFESDDGVRRGHLCLFPDPQQTDNAAVLLDLDSLGPIEQISEWKNLVLPSGHRQMVQAMVETHTEYPRLTKDGNKVGMDLVSGKGEPFSSVVLKAPPLTHVIGRGCIILLHGVPGVGKTSTAGKCGEPES